MESRKDQLKELEERVRAAKEGVLSDRPPKKSTGEIEVSLDEDEETDKRSDQRAG